MNVRRLVSMAALILSPAALALAASPASSMDADASSSRFSLASQTQVPGLTLEPGDYSIRLVDHLSDRVIVRVDKPGGGAEAMFIGLAGSGLAKPPRPGPIKLSGGSNGPAALRGFEFPNGMVVEFVYPKAEAVTLAKANDTKIPAIDPASEGRVADPTLSPEDMKMVTLWMLTPEPVGPGDKGPGIAAARYEPPAGVRPKARPVVASLPHTAGMMPLVGLAGLLWFGAAGLLAYRRMARIEL